MFPGAIEFLSPLWGWAALAAVGVPVAAHLLSRRGGRLVWFPAVRFVQQATADRARFMRPRHWLMLLVRVLILALVVAAFTRPLWYRRRPLLDVDRGVTTVLVLDRSASMRRTRSGASLFDQARRKAIATLEQLDPQRDLASVLLLDAHPAPLLPQPTAGFANLIAMLEDVEPTFDHGDLGTALHAALAQSALAEESPDTQGAQPGRRPVHIELFSDMQRTQISVALRSGPRLHSATLRMHRFDAPADNLAVFNPRMNPVRPVLGQRATFSVELANFGTTAAEPRLSMQYGSQKHTLRLSVPAGSQVTAVFSLVGAEEGLGRAQVALDGADETFRADDQTALNFNVDHHRRVALFTDADADDPLTAAYYLDRALRPERSDEQGPRLSGVALARWKPRQLQAGLRRGEGLGKRPAVVVLVEAASIDLASLRALEAYLRQGGGVLWVIDSPEAAEALVRFSALGGAEPISPIAVDPSGQWRRDANLGIAGGRFDQPILSVFEGPPRGAIIDMKFQSVLAGGLVPSAEPLLVFEDGTPALATRWHGSGRLAVMGTDLAPQRSDLVKGPVLVTLVHQILRHLSPGIPQEPNSRPGARPILAVEGRHLPSSITLNPPGAKPLAFIVLTVDDRRTVVQLDRTTEPGHYELFVESAVAAAVTVELDPRESDLAGAEDELLAALTGESAQGQIAASTEALLRTEGLALWPYLAAVALLLAATESLLLMRLAGPRRRRHRARNSRQATTAP